MLMVIYLIKSLEATYFLTLEDDLQWYVFLLKNNLYLGLEGRNISCHTKYQCK